MNAIKSIHVRRQGSVLLCTLGFLFLTLILVISIVTLSSTHRAIAFKQVNMDQAMYVAEAGLERGCRFIESNIVYLSTTLNVGSQTNVPGTFNSGTFAYDIFRTNSTTFSIVSTGTVAGISRAVSILRIYQPTYAEFALWSATNGAIYFAPGEVFNGHVHADDALYFNTSGGGATFHSYCDSLATNWYAQGSSGGAVMNGSLTGVTFDYGLQTSTYMGKMADVDFNSSTNTSLKNIATSLGLVLNGTSTLTFNGATISISNTALGWTNHVYTPNTTNGIIYVANNGTTAGANAANVYMNGGTITGRLTIVSENDFWIQGNIRYASDPRSNSAVQCALGLVTRDDIHITTNMPNNCEIDAVMMCTGTSGDGSPGSFGVDNYNSGSGRGTLTVYGGIVQAVRGAVGLVGGSSGYSKNYSYDPRFIGNPPPYYPAIAGMVRFEKWVEGPRSQF